MNLLAHSCCHSALTRTHCCPFRKTQLVHYVVEQSQCKNSAALPRRMSVMWWKCIKLTGRAEANVSIAAGQDAACLPALQCDLGHFIEFCRRSSEKTQRPWHSSCHRKQIKTFFLFFFYESWHFWTLDTLVIKSSPLNAESEERSIIWAADKGNLTVVRTTLADWQPSWWQAT